MARTMTATQVKAHILKLLDDVADGEEVTITKHGRVVARLVPASGAHELRGMFAGVVRSSANDEDLFTTGVTWNAQ